MKKTLLTLGTLAAAASPLTTVMACGVKQGSKYFYEIIIDPVNFNDGLLSLYIFHLPTESADEINDDFREEYWRRLYGDLGQTLYTERKTLVIKKMMIDYSSIDHVDDGGTARWWLDFTDNDKYPFSPSIIIPEHTVMPGELIYAQDENGLEELVEATEKTVAPERTFYLQTLQQLFTESLIDFVDKDSLLMTTPTGNTIDAARWNIFGYLFRELLRQHLVKVDK